MRTLFLLLIVTTGFAQNQALTNVADSQQVSLNDFKGTKAVVVIFTSNVCAYDGYYSQRLKSLFSEYGARVQFVLVNSNLEAEETPEKMKAKYDLWAYGVPYLADKEQWWMKFLGAKKSPEVFVLDADGKVVYTGAIDDNPQLAGGVKENYLKKALDDLMNDRTITQQSTRVVGCSIRSN